MATQNRDLYSQDEIDTIRREFGVPINESMNAAIEETKDLVVGTATNVAGVAAKVDRSTWYFIAGFFSGMIVPIIIRHFN